MNQNLIYRKSAEFPRWNEKVPMEKFLSNWIILYFENDILTEAEE